MAVRIFRNSFGGGEISNTMYARVDDAKNQTGLAKCKNFIVEPQGPVFRRPGFEYVAHAKYSDKKCRLIPFLFSLDQTMVLEVGHKYIRFHTHKQTLMSGNAPYEITTPYEEADLFELSFVQSIDVITIAHINYPTKTLRRHGATDWRLENVNFNTTLAAPTGLAVTQTIGPDVEEKNKGLFKRKYGVTALNADASEESPLSATVEINCNPFADGAYNTITWNAVPGAAMYRVYRNVGGVYSYIGQTSETSIIDDAISPDSGITPPRYDSEITSGYPGTVSYFDQRKIFAGTRTKPQYIWMTAAGSENSMAYHLPVQATDRISARIYARDVNRIRHLVPLSRLILLTASGCWVVGTTDTDALTPESISFKAQNAEGASSVNPVVVNSACVYAAARGGHLREMGYSYERGGFISGDLCLRAPHLFDHKTVIDIAYSKAPNPIIWSVSSDGVLVAFTYIPEQQIGAFSTIETRGSFESVTVVSEGYEDIPYVVTSRRINGQTVRFIERMHEVQSPSRAESCYVDCAGFYQGNPTKTITGLSWLEGETVSILADGYVVPDQKVVSGKVVLEDEASTVYVGLQYDSDMVTLPIHLQLNDMSYGTSHRKNITEVTLRLNESSGVSAGSSFEKLYHMQPRATELPGYPPNLRSGIYDLQIKPKWSDEGQVYIRQSLPLPLRITSITTTVEIS